MPSGFATREARVPPFFSRSREFGYAPARLDRPEPPRLLARYRLDGSHHYGYEEGSRFLRLSAAPWLGGVATGLVDDPARCDRLAPCEPTKIVCVGLNYVEHVRESLTVLPGTQEPPREPLLFLKPPSSVLAPGGTIRYPAGVTRLDPEGEMALVIGRRASAVAERDALAHVAGVTALNDVSARNWQKADRQWTRAKGHDTFAPFGPVIALGLSPLDLGFELRVNGDRRQAARTSAMHFGPAFLVAWISRHLALEPGDVIATGTPAGIAPLEPGDRVELELEGVGVLVNTVGERES